MGYNLSKGFKFHVSGYDEIYYNTPPFPNRKEHNYFIVQERDVSYRIYLHQHPYVQKLTERLLTKGTPGLQAADTEYDPNNASLPGSIEIAIDSTISITIPDGSTIALLSDKEITIPNVTSFVLEANMEFKIARDANATATGGMRATLVGDRSDTPRIGAVFELLEDSEAILFSDTKIKLEAAATAITLHDGTSATIDDQTELLLPSGTLFTIPSGSKVTLLKSKPRPQADLYKDIFSNPAPYGPSPLVQRPYPVKDLDFTYSGAYSVYNWELFYHVPITIAIHLSKNQRFAEAQRWFHYLFDPTDNSEGPTPERFWKVRPFHTTDVRKIEEILVNLVTQKDKTLLDETNSSIQAWTRSPFRPHVIARYRQQAYMYKTVMAYLDNLIAWGDSLFRQDTGEAIDEAMMLYVLAANILGRRPQPVPKKGSLRQQTYNNIRKDLREFGTVIREVEADIPFDLMPLTGEDTVNTAQLSTLTSMGKALYFCLPRNDKLLSYWDTVADRLFKIRNSLNFQGVFRQLALFEPPIDPAMLARAAAAGLDVTAIINGLNQPLPLVRFQLLVQKAAEITQEVKSLGNNLLSSMEKEDGEALAILRAKHERVVMEMVEHVKYGQLQEAIKSKEGLIQSLSLAVQRYSYYERQLGKKADEIEKAIPELAELDKESLDKMKFAMKEPEVRSREIEVDIAKDLGDSGGKIISSHEKEEITNLHEARELNNEAATKDKIAAGLSLLPEFSVDIQPFGVGGHVSFGGSALSKSMSLWASFAKTDAEEKTYESGNSSRIGSYARRELDWAFQSNLAAGEISQIFKQLRAAQIREAIAEQELKNHRQQMKHAEDIEHFLNEEGTEKIGKKTNKALYSWMKREVKGLYSQSFQFAFDIAKKAERALQHELGNPELTYLQFGYLAGKEGLLAGEKLYLDIKRMEMAYHELNQREYEMTKHVSLQQVDPLALIQLRRTGRCTVRVPESLFDMDGPGHYFRRIKSVALSIPCVAGPYASVNCTLTLLKSSIRKTQTLRGNVYAREDAEDDRFNDYFGSMQSIVTSSSQNDSGLFETNLRDERYLPFENSGVISEWQLQLPANPGNGEIAQFDYNTISDVILHIRYTAREGGGLLRNGAIKHAKELVKTAQAAGSVRLFSVRHEFPTEWTRFKGTKIDTSASPPVLPELKINLRDVHYPFWSKYDDAPIELERFGLIAIPGKDTPPSLRVFSSSDGTGASDSLDKDQSLNEARVGKLENIPRPAAIGEFSLYLEDNSIEDLFLVLTWHK